jgi:hypothetical protein
MGLEPRVQGRGEVQRAARALNAKVRALNMPSE